MNIKNIIYIAMIILISMMVFLQIVYESPVCHSSSLQDSKDKGLFISEYTLLDSKDTLNSFINISNIYLEYTCVTRGLFIKHYKIDTNVMRFNVYFNYIKEGFYQGWNLNLNDKKAVYQAGEQDHIDYYFHEGEFPPQSLELILSIIELGNETEIDKVKLIKQP